MRLILLIAFGAAVIFCLHWLLARARLTLGHRVTTGDAGMIGMIGRTETELAPFGEPGKVFVHGEIWRAASLTRIPPGIAVRVTRIDGLTIEVEPLYPDRLMIEPPPRSIVDLDPTDGGEAHG